MDHGALATLVLGHFVTELFGTSGGGLTTGPVEDAMIGIQPTVGTVAWPPAKHVDDVGLQLWAERFLARPV